jgi:hypothetical protein
MFYSLGLLRYTKEKQNIRGSVKPEVFTTVNMKTTVFLEMTPRNLAQDDRLRGSKFCFHLQGT